MTMELQRNQRDLQRILWRFASDQPIEHYRMNTVTYGTASAAYLAVRCLQQLGLENTVRFPEASKIISSDFYMDDLLSGCGTIEEAKKLKHEISQMLESGGFVLRKWMSSHKEVLDGAEERGIEYYISNDDGIAKESKRFAKNLMALCIGSTNRTLSYEHSNLRYS
uniref:Uncharacterized protein n=1 Tax=Anoplophora glabripennis TaxID=217634 RepID=V5GP91_ANOGL